MKLIDVFNKILKEDNMGLDPITSSGEDTVIEFPSSNFAISLFRANKTLLFTPQQHTSITNKIRTFVNMIKQNFKVQKIAQKGQGIFEVQLDPVQDFDEVIDFIKNEVDKDENL